MSHKKITTSDAPAPVGPYSQGMVARHGQMLFVSGQIPLDPSTGELVSGGAGQQTARAIENIKAIVEAAGMTLGDVVKTTVFMTDISDFAAIGGVYAQFFNKAPARSAAEVSALPKGAKVMIEAIAVKEQGK